MKSLLKTKVKYSDTGLPTFTTLMAIFTFVSTSLEDNSRTVLSRFQQFLIVLMKLRLNLGDQDLGYRFGVNQSTISRYFKKWICSAQSFGEVAQQRGTDEDYADGV